MTNDNEPNGRFRRRSLLAAGGLLTTSALSGCLESKPFALPPAGRSAAQSDDSEREVVVRQNAGNTFYWVMPGERRLSPHVFGTPDNPRFGRDLLEARIEEAKTLPQPLDDAIPQLLEDLPPLVAAPENAREPIDEEGAIAHEVFTQPTLYSDEAEVTEGEFEVRYQDRQPYDLRGPPGETGDTVDLNAQFTDPAGNEYELEVDHVVKPPIPGYETAGGVMVDAWHHGQTGTGSPLMPKLYAYGAFWAVGDVIVNGETATDDEFRVMHFMTTQTVRDQQYRLAIDEELPLAPEGTIAGEIHHTHGVVLPIMPTEQGPVHEPVPTAFELPNGNTQPFIHAMWEQEELVEAPFADWLPESSQTTPTKTPTETATETPTETETPTATPQNDADFRLGADASAWVGQSPSDIEDVENPSLTLEAGTDYVLVWENLDGVSHNFAIEDENGDDVLETDFLGEEGATQTVEFTASEEMVEYYCQVHPQTMRASIEVA